MCPIIAHNNFESSNNTRFVKLGQQPGVYARIEALRWDMGGGAAFGQNSIISAVMLTASLTTCHQGKERKSNVNAPYFQRFETWLRGLVFVC
jgi:hypothetical protein